MMMAKKTFNRDNSGRFASKQETNGDAPQLAVNQMVEMVSNALLTRQLWLQKQLDPRRDIDDECGFPKVISREDYRILYDREPVARRVVEILPQESWMVQPTVTETADVDNPTEFEKAWDTLDNDLRGVSWYQDEEGSPIWEHLKRVDILSGIGSYGVLLLGVNDGKKLHEPLEHRQGMKLTFLRSFDQSLTDVTVLEKDVTNPRFGQPVTYSLKFNDENLETTTAGQDLTEHAVHWTRVIHIADNLQSSEIFGTPRMQTPFNNLSTIRKVSAGSGEMYWKGAFPGLSMETHPQMGGDVDVDTNAVKDKMEQFMNGLQRYLLTKGMHVNSLATQVVDPTPQINIQIDLVCIQIAVPKRVFIGSERGELASSQDTKAWNGRLQNRQINYITPRIIVPFVDRLIAIGVLPEPEGYSATWPDLTSLTEDEKATIANKRTEAMAKYIQGSVEAILPPMDFLVRELGYTEDQAEVILDKVMADFKEPGERTDEDGLGRVVKITEGEDDEP